MYFEWLWEANLISSTRISLHLLILCSFQSRSTTAAFKICKQRKGRKKDRKKKKGRSKKPLLTSNNSLKIYLNIDYRSLKKATELFLASWQQPVWEKQQQHILQFFDHLIHFDFHILFVLVLYLATCNIRNTDPVRT